MQKVDLLVKIANSAILMNSFKKKYDKEMVEYHRQFPFVRERYKEKNLAKRAKTIGPLYEQYREYKKRFEGYLMIYEQKEYE